MLEVILQRLADFMEKGPAAQEEGGRGDDLPGRGHEFRRRHRLHDHVGWWCPKFQEIFKDFGTELPSITVALLAASNWLIYRYGWLIVLGSPLGLLIAVRILTCVPPGRYAVDWLKLHMPVLGQVVGKSSIARFTRTLGTLIAAGVPILEAINITREATGNEVHARALARMHDAVCQGDALADPLRATGICDDIVVNMIDLGEETGAVDAMLLKIADNHEEEVDILTGSLLSLLEPLMVIVLGAVVGFIIMALFMPLVAICTTIMTQR